MRRHKVLRFQAAQREAALAAEVTRLKADLAVAARALENSCQHAPTRVLAACRDLARWARANADIRALPHNFDALANALVQAGVTTTIQAATRLLHNITIGCNGEPTAEGTNNSFYALHDAAGLRVSKAHVSHAKALTIAARQRDICAVLALAPASVAIPIGLGDTALVVSLSPNYGQSLGRSRSLFQAATDVGLQDAIFSAVLGTIARLSALCVLFHDCKPDNLVFLSDTREVVIVDFDDFLFPGTPLLQPSGLTRADYLSTINGIVQHFRRLQNASGHIIDYYLQQEVQYATPCFAFACATVHAGPGGDASLLPNCSAALSAWSCREILCTRH